MAKHLNVTVWNKAKKWAYSYNIRRGISLCAYNPHGFPILRSSSIPSMLCLSNQVDNREERIAEDISLLYRKFQSLVAEPSHMDKLCSTQTTLWKSMLAARSQWLSREMPLRWPYFQLSALQICLFSSSSNLFTRNVVCLPSFSLSDRLIAALHWHAMSYSQLGMSDYLLMSEQVREGIIPLFSDQSEKSDMSSNSTLPKVLNVESRHAWRPLKKRTYCT